MPPAGDHVVRISEIPSRRWGLAVDQLVAAAAMREVWDGAENHVVPPITHRGDPSSTGELPERVHQRSALLAPIISR